MDTPRSELVAGLLKESHAAQREMPVVGSKDYPTPWDLCHRVIDAMLDELKLLDHLETTSDGRQA